MSASSLSRQLPVYTPLAEPETAPNQPCTSAAQSAQPIVAFSIAPNGATAGVALPAPARLAPLRLPQMFAPRTAPRNADDVCPITQVAIRDIARTFHAQDGYVYDRAALAEWCLTSTLSPMTREPMPETSRALLGYTGNMRRQARKAGNYLGSPQGILTAIVTGGVLVGALVGPMGLLLYNRSHDYQISPLFLAFSAPAGAAAVGFAAYSIGLPLCQRVARYQIRAQHIRMQPVGV